MGNFRKDVKRNSPIETCTCRSNNYYHSETQISVTMGLKWGNMQSNIRGLVMYQLSPYEQKAFAGAFTKGLPNTVRRVKGQMFRVCPPFIGAYMVYIWANKEHARLERKNPADYEDEE